MILKFKIKLKLIFKLLYDYMNILYNIKLVIENNLLIVIEINFFIN